MITRLLSTLALTLILASCGNGSSSDHKGKTAVAILNPTKGNDIHGRIAFAPVDKGILVIAEVHGLKPGKHGLHIHEKGDCSADDASSAGGHFNPTDMPHGAPDAEKRHVGDLGNIEADENGDAFYERIDTVLKLEGPNSIIGKSVIVHTGVDDFTTQPTGDAGARGACGVIEWSE